MVPGSCPSLPVEAAAFGSASVSAANRPLTRSGFRPRDLSRKAKGEAIAPLAPTDVESWEERCWPNTKSLIGGREAGLGFRTFHPGAS
jgi:hypothetical protein